MAKNLVSVSASVAGKNFDEKTAKVLAIALLSSNPASESFPGKDRKSHAEAILPIVPQLIEAYRNETMTLTVVEQDDQRGMVIKKRWFAMATMREVVEAVISACDAYKIFERLTSYEVEVENPSSATRGRKSGNTAIEVNLPV